MKTSGAGDVTRIVFLYDGLCGEAIPPEQQIFGGKGSAFLWLRSTHDVLAPSDRGRLVRRPRSRHGRDCAGLVETPAGVTLGVLSWFRVFL